ncbi:hypothetical protein EOL73_02585 [Candidatus Saccharibacteria bacterium]|nr:hypothetical protein [Candidatus Saccharibacteria bacterium]
MSRYLLLLILNLPFIAAGFISALTRYKLNKISQRKFFTHISFWLIVLAGLVFAEPLYGWLFANNLTDTEPLSLFDVVQITAIVLLFYIINRVRAKTDELGTIVRDLHQELSILLSKK